MTQTQMIRGTAAGGLPWGGLSNPRPSSRAQETYFIPRVPPLYLQTHEVVKHGGISS